MKTSEKFQELAVALTKAQAVMESATKSSTNPFYHSKFADLWEVWEACRKPLTDNGLSFVQSIGSEKEYFVGKAVIKDKEGNVKGEREVVYIWLSVTSRLLHSSEQWIEDTLHIPVEADPQSIGKNTTYIRRYAMMSLCGITTSDDDGEAVRGDKEITQTQYPKYTKPPQKDTKPSQPILPKVAPQPTPTQAPPLEEPLFPTNKTEESPKQFRQTAPPIVENVKPERKLPPVGALSYIPKSEGDLIGGARHYFGKELPAIREVLGGEVPTGPEQLKEAWAILVKEWSK